MKNTRPAIVVSLATASLLLLAFGSPTVSAAPVRVFVFCDESPGPSLINGNGTRCGVNVKNSNAYCTIHILLNVYACYDVGTGNIVGVGAYVPVGPNVCNPDCFGVNVGWWNGDPAYAYGGCFVWVENPGGDVVRICANQTDGLCVISAQLPNPICLGSILAAGPLSSQVDAPLVGRLP